MPSQTSQSRSPLPALLLLLSATTGLVDAVSVLGLGKVFTANMTGNIVFLGFAAARTPGFMVAPYLVALLSFFLGALVAGRMGRHFSKQPLRQWLIVAAIFEAALLGTAAMVAVTAEGVSLSSGPGFYSIIALTAVAMGYRNATIRQLKVPDLTTTVLTLTIAGIAADSRPAGGANPNLWRRLAAVSAIFLGAAVGAVLVNRLGLAVPLALAAAMILIATLACALHPSARFPHAG
ncbi:YoaK family protein [Sphingomonas sp. RS6]